MQMCTALIAKELSQKIEIKQLGQPICTLTLDLPVFWQEGMTYESGNIYVGRVGEMPYPQDAEGCMLICVGGKLPFLWEQTSCSVLSVLSETDLFTVFNLIQESFSRYEKWNVEMRRILHTTADLEEMLAETAEFLGKSLAICDKNLEIVAQKNPDRSSAFITGMQVSEERVKVFADNHARNTAMREPFFYEIGGQLAYCMNIYKQEGYQGLLTIADVSENVDPGELALYQFFFKFVSRAIERRMERGESRTVTLKMVFRDVLNCVPVSENRKSKAVKYSQMENMNWYCLVMKPNMVVKNLPAEYLCVQFEKLFPQSISFFQDPYIVVFLPIEDHKQISVMHEKKEIFEQQDFKCLKQMVEERFLCAGVSRSFSDIIKARNYFKQAVIALEIVEGFGKKEVFSYFDHCAFVYALQNSCGELTPEYMVPEVLLQIYREKDENGENDTWKTLRTYLDNEMNGMQTARELFIHRTTLQNRLRRIEEHLDLSTADKRLYIRFCIYLLELYDAQK